MEYEQVYALLQGHRQEHMLRYFYKLSEDKQQELLSYISKIDFSIVRSVDQPPKKLGEVTPADALSLKQIKRQRAAFEAVGITEIRAGRVACVLLAGGQGTRLGSSAPKGMYNIGVKEPLSIFECQIKNLTEACEKAGALVHLFIMTSNANDEATRKFFADNNYFGYDKNKIHFFLQSQVPALSLDGKILMEEKYKPVFVPSGNGGWYNSLIAAGFGRLIKKEDIKWMNVYGVDNVLNCPCDPVFIGATVYGKYMCGAKVVKKVSPQEKVGVLCKEDGVPTVLEYYEMPQKLKIRRDVKGELTFCYGVILNYLFNVDKLKETSKKKLPYHLAKKKINCLKGGRHFIPEEPNAYKPETLTVDLVKFMGNCLGFEVEREKEFAPIKNATGVDSVESARKLLAQNGKRV